MIGYALSSGSVAATVPATAIAAVIGIDATGIAPAIILSRSAIRLALWPASNAKQAGDCGTHDEDPNHPDKNLAQILASSAVDTLKGNRR
ncbi:hypothetical protein [Ensifer sp. MJa1]|uniref:hypothetical protein n=1 Tax=Ensifer sp. MJa1 TaxID=2919888 RepID=UPI00300A2753